MSTQAESASTTIPRFFVSQYDDGPATRWNVIDSHSKEWVRRFATESEAQAYADKLSRPRAKKRSTPKASDSHAYELGWLEGCAKRALSAIECGLLDEAAAALRLGLNETERKAAFARNGSPRTEEVL